MYRMFSALLDTLAASFLLIPLFFILWRVLFRSGKRTAYYGVFALYLAVLYSVTGLPSIQHCVLDVSLNYVPFLDMAADPEGALLNLLLFLPLGILAPLLCPAFRSLKKSLLLSLGTSCLIEFLQLFTFRATDINDVIANTLGGLLGALLVLPLAKKWPQLAIDGTKREFFLVCALTFGIMFFLQPYLAVPLWNWAFQP